MLRDCIVYFYKKSFRQKVIVDHKRNIRVVLHLAVQVLLLIVEKFVYVEMTNPDIVSGGFLHFKGYSDYDSSFSIVKRGIIFS